MSWECHCYKARERGREHQPGSHIVCPYCGRTRDHVWLLEAARSLLAWLDEGGLIEPEYRILDPLRGAVMTYKGGSVESEPDEVEDPQLPIPKVPSVSVEVAVSDDAYVFDFTLVARAERLASGWRVWVKKPKSSGESPRRYMIIAKEPGRIVLRESANYMAGNISLSCVDFLADYHPVSVE